MKCLSVRQPWAWLIVHGHKDIENRSWVTKYRGRILIHAPLTFNLKAWLYVRTTFSEIALPTSQGDFATGAIIGSIILVDIVQESTSPWYEGRYGWVLADPLVYVAPQRYRGRLGLFNVPSSDLIFEGAPPCVQEPHAR